MPESIVPNHAGARMDSPVQDQWSVDKPSDLALVGRRVRRMLGAGQPLEPGVRGLLERAFGADLTAVRVHADPESDRLAAALGADAFAAGADLFFRSGAFNPGNAAGLRLLAHEAAHAVQQSRRPAHGATSAVSVSAPCDAGERAADRLAAGALQGRKLDRTGRRAIVRRLDAGEQLVLQRHASWEHRLLGDAPSADLNAIAKGAGNRVQLLTALRDFLGMWQSDPDSVTEQKIAARYPYIRTLRLKASGLLVTYGELNTLPDYMANPGVLDAQPRAMMLPILQAVRQEGYNWINWLLGYQLPTQFADAVSINSNWGFLDLLIETKALDNLTLGIGPKGTNHYTALVGRNACHFAPFSWYRWQTYYLIARDLAEQAHAAADANEKARLTYMAWMNHGYADHFLQDSFAAGHLVNKTLIMQWFIEWAAGQPLVPVADWDQVKYMTAARQPNLAARGLYNPASPGTVRDPQTAEEYASLQERTNVAGVSQDGSITQADAYKNYLAFLNSTVVQSSSGALHDHYNKQSLWVASNANATPFQIWGDDTMLNGGDGVRIAGDTAHLSQQSIQELLANGQTSISTQNVWDRFPTKVRGDNNQILSLQQWNDSVRGKAIELFPDVHYYLLRALPRIGSVSIDAVGGWGWQQPAGQAHDIGVGGDGSVWIITTNAYSASDANNFKIARWNGSGWDPIDGAAVRIAVGPDGMPWVVNHAGNIYRRLGSGKGTGWQQVTGQGHDIGIGADGSVWIIDNTDKGSGNFGIARWNGSGWDPIDGAATRISVAPDGKPWVVNAGGGIYQRQGTGRGTGWKQLSGAAYDIGVGSGIDGTAWIINTTKVSGGQGVAHWTGSAWETVPGGAMGIAVGPDDQPWVVNDGSNIYHRVPAQ
jgi:hypothetical protein